MSKLKVGMSKLRKFRFSIENHSYMHMKLESCISPVTSCQVVGVFGARFFEIFMFWLIGGLGKSWLYAYETNEICISHMTPWESPGGPDKLRMAPLSFLKKRHFHGSQWFWKMRISLPQPYGNLSFQKICLTLKFRTLKVSVKIQIWGKSPMQKFRRLQKSHGVWDFGGHNLLKDKISEKRFSAWKVAFLKEL